MQRSPGLDPFNPCQIYFLHKYFQNDLPESGFYARFDFLVTHNQTTLLVPCHKHHPLVRTSVKLHRQFFSSQES